MGFLQNPAALLYFVPSFLIAITVHEVAHAYAAYRLGDKTAAAMGRLTLNPLKHLDPFGVIMLLVVGFGWAKPVLINPSNFRNEKAGMAISALAGPVSNVMLAFAGLTVWYALIAVGSAAEILTVRGNLIMVSTSAAGSVMGAALTFFNQFAILNVWFAVFNLLPVPPLDGSRIVNYFLPPRLSRYYEYVERYGFLALMLLLMFTDILMGPILFVSGLILAALNFPLEWFFNFFM